MAISDCRRSLRFKAARGSWMLGVALGAHPVAAQPVTARAAPVDQPAPASTPSTPSTPSPAPTPAPAAPPAPKAPPIDVVDFVVRGNTVLTEEQIDDALYPYLGAQKTADDIERARDALEKAYASHGFKTVSVQLPAQSAAGGTVLLQVTEGRVGHLRVVGSKYSSIDKIKAQTPSLAEGQVPNFNEVPTDITALNQLPDRRVTPELKAGAAPGTVDVDLDVVDTFPLHGSLELNNRRSEDTHPLRATASLSYDNLWQEGHSLSISEQIAPQHTPDARVFYGSYLARFGASPFSLLFNYIKSDSNVATIGGTDVLGNGNTYTAQAMLTLLSTDTFYEAVSFGVSYKHFNNTTTVAATQGGVPTLVTSKVPISYYPITVGYTAIWRGKQAVTQLDLSASFANPTLGSDAQTFDDNRYQATGQQTYLRGNLSHTHNLPWDFQGYIRAGGQVSDQPLVNTEQFVVGGLDTARGYLEAEALGDTGYVGTVELRLPRLANLLTFDHQQPFDELRFFSFFDYGHTLIRQPLPGQRATYRLASFGAGVNMKIYTYLNGSLVWADPLYDGPATRRRDDRLLFRVWTAF